jgi:hypothetical protein
MTEPNAAWQRWLVLAVSVAGIALAIYCLPLIWHAAEMTLRERLYDTISSATSIALFATCLLIAWRAGDSIPNLAMALALTAASLSDTAYVAALHHGFDRMLAGQIFLTLTFIAGAGLFVRASQHFPRRLTRAQVGNRVLAALLRPAALWPVVIALSLVATQFEVTWVGDVARLVIIAFGIVYFYKSYRTGDADDRRKVLWFLAMAIAAAVFTVVVWAVKLALGDDAPEALRLAVGVTLFSLNSLSMVVCLAAAVFYAGAISPSLVIRKTVVYGVTTALLLFVFATVEVFIHHQLVHLMHVTDTFASSLIGGAFGLTFHPVKHYFEHLLGRVQGRHVAHA